MNGLTEDQARAIAQELCESVGGGRPDHPRLLGDIDRALWIAQHSVTFRAFVMLVLCDGMVPITTANLDAAIAAEGKAP